MDDVMCVAAFAVLSACVGILVGLATSRDPAVADILASDHMLGYAVIFFYYALINGALKIVSQIWRVPIRAVRGALRLFRVVRFSRWLWGGRGCRGSRISRSGRASRPDLARKLRRRRTRDGSGCRVRATGKDKRMRKKRPTRQAYAPHGALLQVKITVLLGVLFGLDLAKFASCWAEVWQPFIFMWAILVLTFCVNTPIPVNVDASFS